MWSPVGGAHTGALPTSTRATTRGRPNNGFNHQPGTKFQLRWLNPLNFLALSVENIELLTLYLRHAFRKGKSKKKNCFKI